MLCYDKINETFWKPINNNNSNTKLSFLELFQSNILVINNISIISQKKKKISCTYPQNSSLKFSNMIDREWEVHEGMSFCLRYFNGNDKAKANNQYLYLYFIIY